MNPINFKKVRQIVKKDYDEKIKVMFICPDEETVRRLWLFLEYDVYPWLLDRNVIVYIDHNIRGMRSVHLNGKSYWEIESQEYIDHHLSHFNFTDIYLVEE